MQRSKPPSARNEPLRRFKCGRCDKRFRRSEHCARHELMHTEERPFVCRYCKKRYGRKDLLRRHERTIHADQWSDSAAQPVTQVFPPPDTGDDSAAEGEHQPPPSLSSGGADELSESTQALDGSRDDSARQTSPAAVPPMVNVSAHSPLPADVATILDQSLTLAAEPLSFLNVGDLGNSLFCYPDATGRSMLRGMLPPVDSPSAAMVRDAANNIGRHGSSAEPLQSPDAGLPSIPQLPSPRTLPNGNVTNVDLAKATPRWHPPSGHKDADYDFHSFDLDFDLGQTPLETWFQNSDNITLHLPIITREPPGQSPRNILDEEGFKAITDDVSARLGLSNPRKATFTFREMQEFINSYIDSFHPHQPFIHLPSLTFTKISSPLILAMASIGALYRLKRRRGYELYELTNEIISSEYHDRTKPGTRGPLWLLQTQHLLAIFGSFSNRRDVAAGTFRKLGHMMLEYQWRRIEVQHKSAKSDKMSWEEWVTVEETKRTLCAMFIFSNMLLTTFNITPGFVIDRDLCIDIPDHESLWAAASADEWDRLRQSLPDTPQQTVQSAVEYMVQPPPEDDLQVHEPHRMSGFTALVVMHAVNIYLWHLNQLSQSVSRVSLGIWPQENLRTALLHAANMTLERCQATLLAGKVDDNKLGLYDPNHAYIFNCGAMLRVAYSRLLPPSHSFNRLVLLTNDENVVIQAVKVYARQSLERDKFVTKAAKLACNGFLGPVTIGALLVSKTAALSWSVEQAIAGWDSALLLTKWVHGLEVAGESNPPDPEEQQIVNDLKALIAETDVSSDQNDQMRSLAALLARVWASFLDDTWVWGVTPNMGFILRLLADEYQKHFIEAGANAVR